MSWSTAPGDQGRRGAPGDPQVAGAGPAVARVRHLTRRYRQPDGSEVLALDDVSFDVPSGRMAIVGSGGSGKTTLLRLLAGVEPPDAGSVEVGGRVVVHTAEVCGPGFDAVAARHRRPAADESARRGERPDPGLLLLDDPLAGLGGWARVEARRVLGTRQRELGVPTVVATGDATDALAWADVVVVLEDGRLVQAGRPDELYDRPASASVARLLGPVNELHGRVLAVRSRGSSPAVVQVRTGLGAVTGRSGLAVPPVIGDPVVAVWRPERATVTVEQPEEPNCWPVAVEAVLVLDRHVQQAVVVGGHRFLIWREDVAGTVLGRAGERMWLAVAPDRVRVLPDGNDRVPAGGGLSGRGG
jgi:ABC-type Fe3+/spermidine/putrescine transport system ATPase subunit